MNYDKSEFSQQWENAKIEPPLKDNELTEFFERPILPSTEISYPGRGVKTAAEVLNICGVKFRGIDEDGHVPNECARDTADTLLAFVVES